MADSQRRVKPDLQMHGTTENDMNVDQIHSYLTPRVRPYALPGQLTCLINLN